MSFFNTPAAQRSSAELPRTSSSYSQSTSQRPHEQQLLGEKGGERTQHPSLGLNPFDYIFRAGRDFLRGFWRKNEAEEKPPGSFTYESETRLPSQEEWQEQNATLLASFEAGFQNLTIANNDPAPKQTLGQSARKVLTPKSIKKACGRSDDPGAWFANKTFVQEGTYIRPQESDTSKRPSILDSSAKKLKQTFSSASCLGKRRSADHDEEQDPPARLVKKACRTSYIKVDELMGDAAHYNFDLNKPAYASRNKPLADAVLTNEQVFGTFAFSSPRTPPDINNHSAFQLSSNPVYDNSVVYPESHGYLDELEALSKSARGVDQAGSSKNDQVKEQEEPSLRELRKMLRQPRRGVRTLPPILEEEGSVDGRRSVDENPKSRPSGVDEAVTDLSRRWL